MPTKIAASAAHHNQRLAYQPPGALVFSIERSQRFAAATLREASRGTNNPIMPPRKTRAIAAGLAAAIHRIPPIAIKAAINAGVWRRLLSAIIKTIEINPYAPAKTIGFSRFVGRK